MLHKRKSRLAGTFVYVTCCTTFFLNYLEIIVENYRNISNHFGRNYVEVNKCGPYRKEAQIGG